MRKLRSVLPLALVAAALAAPAAKAAPNPVNLHVSSNARYLSPTSIIVQATVTCPAGLEAFVSVAVQEQNATNTIGLGIATIPCTGNAQTIGVLVDGTGFTPGKAYVNAFAAAGIFSDPDVRQIQIVV